MMVDGVETRWLYALSSLNYRRPSHTAAAAATGNLPLLLQLLTAERLLLDV